MLAVWIICALIFLGAGLFFFIFVRRAVPDPSTEEGRKQGGWVKYEDGIVSGLQWLDEHEVKPLQVMSYDGKKLYGRFIPCENAKGTILFFHGYRSHYAVDFSVSLPFYHQLGYHMLLVDQRAHGQSEGKVITFGIKERLDVLSWVTYLSMMLGEEHPMFLSGLSMGATTVLMAADMEFPANVRGILADCGFTSPGEIIRHLAEEKYHLPGRLVTMFLNLYTSVLAGFGLDEWSTVDALRQTRLPVLLSHGEDDHFVPCRMSQEAFDACNSEKRLELYPGAGHGVSYLSDTPRYQAAIREFLEAHT